MRPGIQTPIQRKERKQKKGEEIKFSNTVEKRL
jgi:hypothetical protein